MTNRGWAMVAHSLGLFPLSTHYASNTVLALAAMTFSLTIMAVLSGWSALAGVSAELRAPHPVAAGGRAALRVAVANASQPLLLRAGELESERSGGDEVTLPVWSQVRGLALVGDDAFGLFEARRWERRILKRLARLGFTRAPHEGLRSFFTRIPGSDRLSDGAGRLLEEADPNLRAAPYQRREESTL